MVFHQPPSEKYYARQNGWKSSTIFGMNIPKNIWKHHLVLIGGTHLHSWFVFFQLSFVSFELGFLEFTQKQRMLSNPTWWAKALLRHAACSCRATGQRPIWRGKVYKGSSFFLFNIATSQLVARNMYQKIKEKICRSFWGLKYCWWLRNPKQPPGMLKNLVINGINYQPQLLSLPEFSHQQ